jgi:hypothetical protein
MKIYN